MRHRTYERYRRCNSRSPRRNASECELLSPATMSRNVDHDVFRVSSNRKAFLHTFRSGRLRRWCQCLSHAISFSRSAWKRVTDAPRPASNSDATRMTVSQESTIRAFAAQLKQADRKATARYSPGSDIAACGHSVRKENRQKTMTSGLKVPQA